ncbi:MAG: ATP-binding protein [Sulfurimonadaceae bacterium]
MFQRYRRFDTTHGGFGIGYSIIKSIIDEYGIKINIKSELDKGTEVTLTW